MTDPVASKLICGQFCEYCKTKYSKFIPIFESKNDYKFPQSKIDKESPKCWFDIQTWYVDYCDEKTFRKQNVKASCSESSVDERCQHNCHVKEIFFDGKCRRSLITDKRYGTNNIKFLEHGSTSELNESQNHIEIYIRILKEQSTLRLCHIKTELIVKCLQIFFKPYNNTTVLWVSDLNSYVAKARTSCSKDIFNEVVDKKCSNVKAVLYLDRRAAKLIRHKDTCFIDTLAAILETSKDELLILPMYP